MTADGTDEGVPEGGKGGAWRGSGSFAALRRAVEGDVTRDGERGDPWYPRLIFPEEAREVAKSEMRW